MSVTQPSRVLDVRSLPNTCEVQAFRDGGQFPVMVTGSENTLITVLRGGAGHLGTSGRLEVIRSRDAGRTWTPGMVVADSAIDDRNPALGLTPQGTLIIAYHCQGSYDEEGWYRPHGFENPPIKVKIIRSFDAGLTWSDPVVMDNEQLAKCSPYGKIVTLGDGTLLMPIYGTSLPTPIAPKTADGKQLMESHLIRSRDDGATWSDPSLIATGTDETSLVVLPDGNLLAVLRGNSPHSALFTSRSTDGGYSWSEPVQVTQSMQHPADVIVLSDNTLLLTYGNRTSPYRVEGRVSFDQGETWTDLLLLFSAPLYGTDLAARTRTDLGYPSSAVVQTDAGRQGATIYYYNPDIPQTENWMETGPTGPFYSSSGYRAIAVCWDEAELLAAIRR